MLLRRIVAATCLLALTALGLAACGGDDDQAAGTVIAARTSDQVPDGDKSWVLVPTGVLRVSAGKPTTSIGADETRDNEAYDAPAGSTYVPISWRFTTKRYEGLARILATQSLPTVELATGGASHRLPPPSRLQSDKSFYVLVDGDGKDLQLEVEFDGVTQTVDLRSGKREPGQARGLYRLDKRVKLPTDGCGAPDWFEVERTNVDLTCEITGPVFLPYAAGRWADPGRWLLVVELRTVLKRAAQAGPEGAGVQGAWWYADDVQTKLRIRKQQPVSVNTSRGDDHICPVDEANHCRYSAIAVFDVADRKPQKLRVQQDYRWRLAATWGDFEPRDKKKVTMSGTVRLR